MAIADHTAFCNICEPRQEMPAPELLDHLRLMHPDHMDGIAQWPDGRYLITEEVPDTVEELGWTP